MLNSCGIPVTCCNINVVSFSFATPWRTQGMQNIAVLFAFLSIVCTRGSCCRVEFTCTAVEAICGFHMCLCQVSCPLFSSSIACVHCTVIFDGMYGVLVFLCAGRQRDGGVDLKKGAGYRCRGPPRFVHCAPHVCVVLWDGFLPSHIGFRWHIVHCIACNHVNAIDTHSWQQFVVFIYVLCAPVLATGGERAPPLPRIPRACPLIAFHSDGFLGSEVVSTKCDCVCNANNSWPMQDVFIYTRR